MKKITFLFILVFLTTTSLFGQLRDSIWWSTPYFQIVYSEVLEQPKWIQYRVACSNGKASRSGMDFYKEKGIKTSDHKDYEHNVWDKGHMAPAASFSCNRDMIFATFTYMNCALQHQSLNRGVWKHLEIRERELANQWPIVDITIRIVFDEKPTRVEGGASIPKGFYKIIKYGNVVESYYFPNQMPTSSDYKTYRVK
jgi:endonuclease G